MRKEKILINGEWYSVICLKTGRKVEAGTNTLLIFVKVKGEELKTWYSDNFLETVTDSFQQNDPYSVCTGHQQKLQH